MKTVRICKFDKLYNAYTCEASISIYGLYSLPYLCQEFVKHVLGYKPRIIEVTIERSESGNIVFSTPSENISHLFRTWRWKWSSGPHRKKGVFLTLSEDVHQLSDTNRRECRANVYIRDLS